jgi:hypothetical protein
MHVFRIIQRYRFPISSQQWMAFFSSLYHDLKTLDTACGTAETSVEALTDTRYDTYIDSSGTPGAAITIQRAARVMGYYNSEA